MENNKLENIDNFDNIFTNPTDYVTRSQFEYDDVCENEDDYFIEKNQLLQDIPLELNINYDDFSETFNNLYKYYLSVENIKDLPDIFYQEYIYRKCEEIFAINNHKLLIDEFKKKIKKI